jgi:hypothetical protein
VTRAKAKASKPQPVRPRPSLTPQPLLNGIKRVKSPPAPRVVAAEPTATLWKGRQIGYLSPRHN